MARRLPPSKNKGVRKMDAPKPSRMKQAAEHVATHHAEKGNSRWAMNLKELDSELFAELERWCNDWWTKPKSEARLLCPHKADLWEAAAGAISKAGYTSKSANLPPSESAFRSFLQSIGAKHGKR